MPGVIKESTRKKLWAKSAGRCAICGMELIRNNPAINVGQECHIVGLNKTSARHQENFPDINGYDNLILLCANHHKIIDSDTLKYTIAELKRIKKEHEEKIEKKLSKNNTKINVLSIIKTGEVLASLIFQCHGRKIFPSLTNPFITKKLEELDDITSDLQNIQEALDFSEKESFYKDLDIFINELESKDCSLYADIQTEHLRELSFPILYLTICEGHRDICILETKY